MSDIDSSHNSLNNHNFLSEKLLEESVENYERVTKENVKGPQLQGLDKEWARQALEDPDTVSIEYTYQGNRMLWPLLSPVKHNLDYSSEFFNTHYPSESAHYLSLPTEDILQEVFEDETRKEALTRRVSRGIIAYDYQDSDGEGNLRQLFDILEDEGYEVHEITPPSSAYGMEYGSPIVSHFEGDVEVVNPPSNESVNIDIAFLRLVEQGEYAEMPEKGPTLLTPDLLRSDDALLEQIWEIYDDQFNELTEDHPSLQKQPKDELFRMLIDDEAVNIAYMDEGKVAGLCYFVRNTEKCAWLNEEYFKSRETDGRRIGYYPGIVVAKEKARLGLGYAQSMIGLLADLVHEANAPMRITFQCTNVSETYIPKIVTDVINAHSDKVQLTQPPDEEGSAFNKVATYKYGVARVT